MDTSTVPAGKQGVLRLQPSIASQHIPRPPNPPAVRVFLAGRRHRCLGLLRAFAMACTAAWAAAAFVMVGTPLTHGGATDLVAVGTGAPAPRDVDDKVDLARSL